MQIYPDSLFDLPGSLRASWLADEPASSQQPPKDEEQAEEAILTSENPTDTKAPEPSTRVEAAIDTAKAATRSAVDTAKQAASSVTGQAEESSLGRAAFAAQESPPVPTVYVGNLFFDVTAETLEQKFAEAGPIRETKVMRDGRGLSKGFGYVEFEDADTATRAIELFNMQNFEGRRLSVQFSRPRAPRAQGDLSSYRGPNRARNPPTRTLFFGNMSFDMSDRDLNALFRSVKNVVDVRVAIDRRTGQPRGFAHADFTDVASAESAMEEMQGKMVGGRALRIDFSTSTGRASLGDAKGALGEAA
ncbi:MAG: hypothetical protein OHK93_002479 [Ramalina farinacea]|uniref:RRM domain-containing protein n=1 Tax=Ramalina farinacea TaxID=258253 RepID=A0AA43QVW7_9LECA|nr:hypothetical protein [Ramalina farinacea]